MTDGGTSSGSERRRTTPAAALSLPAEPDATGSGWEEPRWNHLGALAAFVAAMVAIGILGITGGSPLVGWLFIVLGVASGTVVCAMAARLERSLFAAPRGATLSDAEAEALADDPSSEQGRAAREVELVGGLFGRRDGEPMAAFSSALDSDEARAVEDARAREAAAALAWVGASPEPVAVRIPSDDGTSLAAHVYAPNQGSDRWLVFAHGYDGCWNEGIPYARHYAERGFNLLLPEMRGHATSGGACVGMGWPDRRDLVRWARWLVDERGGDVRIVMHGHSMGGAAVCLAIGEDDLPSQVVAAVSDCAYSDAWNVLVPVLRDGMRTPPHPTLDLVRLDLMLGRDGYDLAEAAPAASVAHAHAPLLVMHGERDSLVPPYMARKIYDAAGGAASGEDPAGNPGKKLCMFAHAGHCQASLANSERYYWEVFNFVEPRL